MFKKIIIIGLSRHCIHTYSSTKLHNSVSLSQHTQRQISNVVRLYYNDMYQVQLPTNHKFPMQKYRHVRNILQNEFGSLDNVLFIPSPLATREELVSTHCSNYVDRYLSGVLSVSEIRKSGFPWTQHGVNRSLSSVGGTLAAMRAVCSSEDCDAACHIAGGTHHAFYDYGEGFCIFNDLAVASNIALREFNSFINQILILDLDVHQGNGNAQLFQNNNKVFTFSMHCQDNYFSTIQKSNVDVELPKGTNDEEYLNKLKIWLPYLIDIVKPQLVFYQAGVDIYEGDRLGKLNVTKNGIQRRNQIVFNYLRRRKVKVVVCMGGGYPKDLDPESTSYKDTIMNHVNVYKECILTFTSNSQK